MKTKYNIGDLAIYNGKDCLKCTNIEKGDLLVCSSVTNDPDLCKWAVMYIIDSLYIQHDNSFYVHSSRLIPIKKLIKIK